MIEELDIEQFVATEQDVIFDVRDRDAYLAGHIQYAQHRPIGSLTAETLQSIEQQTIYILCGGGTKAPRAATLLNDFDSQRQYIILSGGTRKAKALGMTIIQGE